MSRTYNTRPAHIRFKDHYKNRQDEYYTVQMIGYRYGKFEYVYTPGKWFSKKVFVPFDEPQVYEYTASLQKSGIKRKLKKVDDTECHWMTTPMHHIRLHMNQPQRTHGKEWEREVVKYKVEDLEDIDTPSVGRKPHIYYW